MIKLINLDSKDELKNLKIPQNKIKYKMYYRRDNNPEIKIQYFVPTEIENFIEVPGISKFDNNINLFTNFYKDKTELFFSEDLNFYKYPFKIAWDITNIDVFANEKLVNIYIFSKKTKKELIELIKIYNEVKRNIFNDFFVVNINQSNAEIIDKLPNNITKLENVNSSETIIKLSGVWNYNKQTGKINWENFNNKFITDVNFFIK